MSTIPAPAPNGFGYIMENVAYTDTCTINSDTLISQEGFRIGMCQSSGSSSSYVFNCNTTDPNANVISVATFSDSSDCTGTNFQIINQVFNFCNPIISSGQKESFAWQACAMDSDYATYLPLPSNINFVVFQQWDNNDKCSGKPFSYVAQADNICSPQNVSYSCNNGEYSITSYKDNSCKKHIDTINFETTCIGGGVVSSSFTCYSPSGDDSTQSSTGTSSLSGGAIFGIVIAVLAFLCIAGGVVWFYIGRTKKTNVTRESELNANIISNPIK